MTEFEKLCDELDNILAIDRDVLAMLIISLAGKRDIVASCSSISYAEDYLKAVSLEISVLVFLC